MKTYTVSRICAWCGIEIGTVSGMKKNEPTHGMCEACYMKHLPDSLLSGIVDGMNYNQMQYALKYAVAKFGIDGNNDALIVMSSGIEKGIKLG